MNTGRDAAAVVERFETKISIACIGAGIFAGSFFYFGLRIADFGFWRRPNTIETRLL